MKKEYNIFIISITAIITLPLLTVTTKYGLGNALSLLILAPGSHVPQCVEIFDGMKLLNYRFCSNSVVYDRLYGTISFGWLDDILYL